MCCTLTILQQSLLTLTGKESVLLPWHGIHIPLTGVNYLEGVTRGKLSRPYSFYSFDYYTIWYFVVAKMCVCQCVCVCVCVCVSVLLHNYIFTRFI